MLIEKRNNRICFLLPNLTLRTRPFTSAATHMLGKLGEIGRLGTSYLFASTSCLCLVGFLAILEFLNGSGLRVLAQRRLLCRLFLDVFECGTNDSTLDFTGSSTTFFGGCFGDSLLVQTTPGLRPYQFGRFLALDGQTKRLGGTQPQGLAVTANHQFSMTGINTVLRESTEFGYNDGSIKR